MDVCIFMHVKARTLFSLMGCLSLNLKLTPLDLLVSSLANELQGSTYPFTPIPAPSTRLIHLILHISLTFTWMLEISTQVLMLAEQAL